MAATSGETLPPESTSTVPGSGSTSPASSAATVIHGRVRRTPVMSCASLGEGVWLKAELFQRTGAFKVRGAFSRIAELSQEELARGVVTCSAGNHAAAVALAGRELGTNALVMMPRWASQAKVDATRAYGGTADLESADASEAFARMHAEAEESGRVIVHPFDDRAVMAGQGTLGLELCEQVGEVSGDRAGHGTRSFCCVLLRSGVWAGVIRAGPVKPPR